MAIIWRKKFPPKEEQIFWNFLNEKIARCIVEHIVEYIFRSSKKMDLYFWIFHLHQVRKHSFEKNVSKGLWKLKNKGNSTLWNFYNDVLITS